MDFGIARAMHDGQSSMTQTAAVIGTAQYLSPEQARGESVDARSDVYAAGCVLYELITGEPPFTGDSPVAVAYQHVREDPSPPSSVNPAVAPELDAVVLKALAKGPANRYQSAAEMRSDLVRTLSGQRPAAPMVMSEDERTQVMNTDRRQPQRYEEYDAPDDEDPKAKRRRRMILAALAAVFVLGAVLLIMWLSGSFKGGGGEETGTVAIPDVKGQSEVAAKNTLRDKGLNNFAPNKTVACGVPDASGTVPCTNDQVNQVIDITPGVGTPVAKEAQITLTIGQPPGKAKVPDLKDLTPGEAEAKLKEVGLTLNPSVQEVDVDDSNDAGKVVNQTPQAGNEVQQGSSVSISIGKGKQLKQVPNLIGKTFAEANSTLTGMGFTVKRVEQQSDQPKEQVIQQTPNGGQVTAGSQITLTVSTGQPEDTKIEMPSLVGMTVDEAQQKLQSMGWTQTLKQQSDRTSNKPEGQITRQSVSPGTQIDKDQKITVSVSEGPLFPTSPSSGP
jgi:beta-lactam-binding protein with PASTA domain